MPDSISIQLRDTSHLPENAIAYTRRYRRRVAADPLGTCGLTTRQQVDRKVVDICRVLRDNWQPISGDALAKAVGLPNARSLRHMIAYARVHHRLREIVGMMDGSGYVWGPSNPGYYDQAAWLCKRHAMCELYAAALYRSSTAAIELAQLSLDFAKTGNDREYPPTKHDELELLMAADRVSPADVIEALINELDKTELGRQTLAKLGQKHAGRLLPENTISEMIGQLDQMKQQLMTAGSNTKGV